MASKDTIVMIHALSDETRLKIFEVLAESDRSDKKISEMLGMDLEKVRSEAAILEKSGLITIVDECDYFDYVLDPKKVAELTGFFELMLNKCTPPKCC